MEFNPRNAFWRDVPAFNQYVARVQSLMQGGRADNDVLLYWPIWDNWHDVHSAAHGFPRARSGLVPRQAIRSGRAHAARVRLRRRLRLRPSALRAGVSRIGPRAQRAEETTRRSSCRTRCACRRRRSPGCSRWRGAARLCSSSDRCRQTCRVSRVSPSGGRSWRRRSGRSPSRRERRACAKRGSAADACFTGDRVESLLDAASVRRDPLATQPNVRFIRRRSGAG